MVGFLSLISHIFPLSGHLPDDVFVVEFWHLLLQGLSSLLLVAEKGAHWFLGSIWVLLDSLLLSVLDWGLFLLHFLLLFLLLAF